MTGLSDPMGLISRPNHDEEGRPIEDARASLRGEFIASRILFLYYLSSYYFNAKSNKVIGTMRIMRSLGCNFRPVSIFVQQLAQSPSSWPLHEGPSDRDVCGLVRACRSRAAALVRFPKLRSCHPFSLFLGNENISHFTLCERIASNS